MSRGKEAAWDATLDRAMEQAERGVLESSLYKVLDDAFSKQHIHADEILKIDAVYLGDRLAGNGMPVTPTVQIVLDRIDRDKDDVMWS